MLVITAIFGFVSIATNHEFGGPLPIWPRCSPTSCKCVKVGITGAYSPGALLRCTQCLDVRRSKEKNSCPKADGP